MHLLCVLMKQEEVKVNEDDVFYLYQNETISRRQEKLFRNNKMWSTVR